MPGNYAMRFLANEIKRKKKNLIKSDERRTSCFAIRIACSIYFTLDLC